MTAHLELHRTTTAALLRALGGDGVTDRLAACLELRGGRHIGRVAITDFVWGDDPDGGPGSNSLAVLLSRMRGRGVLIETRRQFGWAMRAA
jgi:hypothetical protein